MSRSAFRRGGGVKRRRYHRYNWCVSVLLMYFMFENTSCSDLSSGEGVSAKNESEIMSNVTTGSARNSRQLWSLVKNVIKTGLEQSGNNGGGNGGSSGIGGGLGTLASLFGSAIASGINSDGVGHQHQPSYHQPQNLSPNQFGSPNEYMHYLLMNSQSNQHTSLPHYLQMHQKEQESTVDLIEKYKEQMASGSENQETATSTGNQILNKLALGTIFEDLDKVSSLLSFRTVENMIEKVNKFDNLKCIPRLMCQMVAKRAEDQKKEDEKKKAKARDDSTSTTTKRPVERKVDDDEEDEDDDKRSRVDMEEREGDGDDDDKEEKKTESKEIKDDVEDEEEDDDDEDDSEEEIKEYEVIKKGTGTVEAQDNDGEKGKGRRGGRRNGRFLSMNGADTALEQFVKFLELMQLKDWSLYPYLNGAYQGHQVSRSTDCANRFSSCPFSDDQLVYYFNNYNGGFFQSI